MNGLGDLSKTRAFGFLMDHRADHDLRGEQWLITFPNGYGASVIKGPYSYGGPEGHYEIAVMHPDHLCYATPVTDDVIGWLDKGGVATTLRAIKRLPANTDCTHRASA